MISVNSLWEDIYYPIAVIDCMTLENPNDTDRAELTVSLNVLDWSMVMAGLKTLSKQFNGKIDSDGIDVAGMADDAYIKLRTRLTQAPVRPGSYSRSKQYR